MILYMVSARIKGKNSELGVYVQPLTKKSLNKETGL
jgi:hypothetical protein